MQQRIDKSSVGISRSRMNHHAPRFIDHDHGFILEKDIQRDILRDQFDGLRLLEGKLDDISRGEAVIRLRRFPGTEDHRPLLQPFLFMPAASVRNLSIRSPAHFSSAVK